MIADLRPYPKYKESGLPRLGKVPGHWQTRRLKTVARLNPSKSESTSLLRNNALATFLPMERVGTDGQIDVREKRPASSLWNGFTYFRRNDVLLAKITPCFENGKGACLSNLPTEIGFGSTEFHVLRPKSELSPRFLYLQTCLAVFRDLGARSMTGSAGQQRVPSRFVEEHQVIIPPPAEQAAIVRFLEWANGRLERAIGAKRKVIALLNEQKQAIIHRAVTRGLDPSVALKPSGIPWLGDIPQHWEVRPLKAVCEIQSGITLGKDYVGQTIHEYPYLRVANVQAGHANLAVVKTIHVTKAEALRCTLQAGDVLMTEGGDPDKLGRGCVWNAQVAPCLHQNHVFAVRPNQSKLEPHFLSALMGTRYARAYFESTAKQTTNLASTNKTKIGQFQVLLPNVDEQQGILTALNEETRPVDTAISRLEREIELLREYRTRLVADVVTGKLDVREAAGRLPEEAAADIAEDDTDLSDETEPADEEVAV